MARAALSAQTAPAPEEPTGALSSEEELDLPRDAAWIELQASLLYMHLDTAARNRQRLERSGGADHAAERNRQKAVERAREIYDQLTGEGWRPDGLLAQMMLAERA
jgi:hypothetical protein